MSTRSNPSDKVKGEFTLDSGTRQTSQAVPVSVNKEFAFPPVIRSACFLPPTRRVELRSFQFPSVAKRYLQTCKTKQQMRGDDSRLHATNHWWEPWSHQEARRFALQWLMRMFSAQIAGIYTALSHRCCWTSSQRGDVLLPIPHLIRLIDAAAKLKSGSYWKYDSDMLQSRAQLGPWLAFLLWA